MRRRRSSRWRTPRDARLHHRASWTVGSRWASTRPIPKQRGRKVFSPALPEVFISRKLLRCYPPHPEAPVQPYPKSYCAALRLAGCSGGLLWRAGGAASAAGEEWPSAEAYGRGGGAKRAFILPIHLVNYPTGKKRRRLSSE